MSLAPLRVENVPPPTLCSKLSIWTFLPEENFLNLWEVFSGLEFYHSGERGQEHGGNPLPYLSHRGIQGFLIQGKEFTVFIILFYPYS